VEPVFGEPRFLQLNTDEIPSRRDRVVRGLHYGAFYSGLSAAASRLTTKTRATILMYHSVPTADEARWMDPANCMSPARFEQQMAFLARRRHVISLRALVEMLEEGKPFQPGTVVVTFDDGYLNNLTVAAPILDRHGIPATIFLNTGSIETGTNQWVDEVYSAFRTRTADTLDLTAFDPTAGPWTLGDPVVDTQAYQATCGLLVDATVEQRDDIQAAMVAQLAPAAAPPNMTMTWDDVRTLRSNFPAITLGVHSANHIDLRQHPEQIEHEARACINHYERNLGTTPEHFAFPYNRHDAVSEEAVAQYFRSSVGENPADPVIRPGAAPHGMQRVAAPSKMALLRSFTDGGYPSVPQRLVGKVWSKPF
jgi:peptidoglycan/xylan/chitin deacetylase (PgdA/CDA1 family)